MKPIPKYSEGFTLVEILVAVLILSVLGFYSASYFNYSANRSSEDNKRHNVEAEMREFFTQVKKNLSSASSLAVGGTGKTPFAGLNSFPQITITQDNQEGNVVTKLSTECVNAPADVIFLYEGAAKNYLCIQCPALS